MQSYTVRILEDVQRKNSDQPEFLQAVTELLHFIDPVIARNHTYEKHAILERIVEPERIIIFRIPWFDDQGHMCVNRGIRVQYNSALGPYKGGLRFHPSVNLSKIKFLGFEQIFKNSLTTLPLGGGKGGSDFDPKGKSDTEIMRFCQSYMTELFRHIGDSTDVPAGDIGVGSREIGFLFGQYKRLANQFTGVLTGKNARWGGSPIRPEATGYGAVYMAQEMLYTHGQALEGATCAISGSGNVAQYTAEKLIQLGAKPITMSDSGGTIVDADGFDSEKLNFVKELKNIRRGRIHEYAERFKKSVYLPSKRPWAVKCDFAFPSATENELDFNDAKALASNGCRLVVEGANMPSTPEAIELFHTAKILYAPGKASNAGGVATSGFEMSQNSMRLVWAREDVDARLKGVMKSIHDNARATAAEYGSPDNYAMGANIAGFCKVADAMLDQGLV